MIRRPIIECEQISFHYGSEEVLYDVSFSVAAGDYVGMIGGNGSGKTTLLKIILGLLRPTGGEIRLFSESLETFRLWNKVGYVPQNVFRGDMNFPATVREVVESGHFDRQGGFWCRFGAQRCEAVEAALVRAGIAHLAKKRIGELSGGERQKVFIARALVSRPELLVLDEPTTGIDAKTEEQFYVFLNELNRSGMTILLVSHDLEVVAREVKKVLCLNRRVISYGTPQLLRSDALLSTVYGTGKQFLHHHHKDV